MAAVTAAAWAIWAAWAATKINFPRGNDTTRRRAISAAFFISALLVEEKFPATLKLPMKIISEQNQRQFAWVALVFGLLMTAGGVFGIWMQGRMMYDGTPLHTIYDVLCLEEVYESICLAPLVTSVGVLLLSWVILASKLTEKFSAIKKNVWFGTFAAILLMVIMVSSRIAANQDWSRAESAVIKHFENIKTNTPTQ